MKPLFFAVTTASIFFASLNAHAGSGALRITCDGDNAGASIYINGKLKGECPLDMKVPEGKVKLRAAKAGDEEHEPKVFEQEIYVGDGVAKKVEVQFGVGGLTAVGKQRRQEAELSDKKQRYEAELADYNKNIRACLSKHAEELLRVKQVARRAYKSRLDQCVNNKSQRISDIMESSGYSREIVIGQTCGNTSFDKADADGDFFTWVMDDEEMPHEIKEYRKFSKNAKTWCDDQFAAPQAPVDEAAQKRDHATAAFNLGLQYATGKGVAQSYEQAAALYRKAAEDGSADAMNNLGFLYANGQGVAQSNEQAAAWFRKGADAGDARAMANLAYLYMDGKGVAQSEEQAAAWTRKAADAGYAEAMSNLGAFYAMGKGVEKSDEQAAAWTRKAADTGLAAAMYNLGHLYERGQGVEKSDVQAVAWFRKAASKGYANAIDALKKRGLQ